MLVSVGICCLAALLVHMALAVRVRDTQSPSRSQEHAASSDDKKPAPRAPPNATDVKGVDVQEPPVEPVSWPLTCDNVRLFVAVASEPSDAGFQRRAGTRATWLSWLPDHLSGKVQYRFFVNEWRPTMRDEMRTHGDIVVLRADASPWNRQLVALRWIARSPARNFTAFLAVSDDSFVCINRIVAELKKRPNERFAWGRFACNLNRNATVDGDLVDQRLALQPGFLAVTRDVADMVLTLTSRMTSPSLNLALVFRMLDLTVLDDSRRIVGRRVAASWLDETKRQKNREFCRRYVWAGDHSSRQSGRPVAQQPEDEPDGFFTSFGKMFSSRRRLLFPTTLNETKSLHDLEEKRRHNRTTRDKRNWSLRKRHGEEVEQWASFSGGLPTPKKAVPKDGPKVPGFNPWANAPPSIDAKSPLPQISGEQKEEVEHKAPSVAKRYQQPGPKKLSVAKKAPWAESDQQSQLFEAMGGRPVVRFGMGDFAVLTPACGTPPLLYFRQNGRSEATAMAQRAAAAARSRSIGVSRRQKMSLVALVVDIYDEVTTLNATVPREETQSRLFACSFDVDCMWSALRETVVRSWWTAIDREVALACAPRTLPSVAQCGKYRERTFRDERSSPAMIASFAGSGNTWARLLLEYGSGIFTGSVYDDQDLMKTSPAEGVDNGAVVAIKAHIHPSKYLVQTQSLKVLYLVRHPFNAIWAEYQRRTSGSHVASVELSEGTIQKFRGFFQCMCCKWLRYTVFHANLALDGTNERLHVVRYEDMVDRTVDTLRGMLRFLGVRESVLTEDRLACSLVLSRDPKVKRKRKVTALHVLSQTPGLACSAWKTLTSTLETRAWIKMFGYTNPVVTDRKCAPFAACHLRRVKHTDPPQSIDACSLASAAEEPRATGGTAHKRWWSPSSKRITYRGGKNDVPRINVSKAWPNRRASEFVSNYTAPTSLRETREYRNFDTRGLYAQLPSQARFVPAHAARAFVEKQTPALLHAKKRVRKRRSQKWADVGRHEAAAPVG